MVHFPSRSGVALALYQNIYEVFGVDLGCTRDWNEGRREGWTNVLNVLGSPSCPRTRKGFYWDKWMAKMRFFLTVLHATSRGMEGQRRVDVVEGRWGMGPLILVYM